MIVKRSTEIGKSVELMIGLCSPLHELLFEFGEETTAWFTASEVIDAAVCDAEFLGDIRLHH